MVAIKTEISESIDTAPSEVEVEQTQTINEVIKISLQPDTFHIKVIRLYILFDLHTYI